jgi:hypothetical protein
VLDCPRIVLVHEAAIARGDSGLHFLDASGAQKKKGLLARSGKLVFEYYRSDVHINMPLNTSPSLLCKARAARELRQKTRVLRLFKLHKSLLTPPALPVQFHSSFEIPKHTPAFNSPSLPS